MDTYYSILCDGFWYDNDHFVLTRTGGTCISMMIYGSLCTYIGDWSTDNAWYTGAYMSILV